MNSKTLLLAALGLLSIATLPVAAEAADSFIGPVALHVDNLANPLGIDDPAPRFSWQLQDFILFISHRLKNPVKQLLKTN